MTMTPTHSSPAVRRRRAGAFTLVEITLSIGIISFAFVGIMGMLPVGLSAFNQSIDTTMEAQIAQRLFADAQQMPFYDLVDLTDAERSFFFDEQGTRIATGSTPPDDGFVYHAVMGTQSGQFTDAEHATTLRVDISRNLLVSEAPAGHVRRLSLVVADVGL